MALTETAIHEKRHARTMSRRAVLRIRRRHGPKPVAVTTRFYDPQTLMDRVWKRQEERAASAAQVEKEMRRIKGQDKPQGLFARLKKIFRRTP